jgi:hypothetical protein
MKTKTISFGILLLLLLPAISWCQESDKKDNRDKDDYKLGIGIKGGLNFANVTSVGAFKSGNQTGFVVGAFLAPPTRGILSFYTEIDFSNQGYDFKTNTTTGSVHLNYILMPQLMSIKITRFVLLQVGFQVAYLVSAQADTANALNVPGSEVLSYYNRVDYGAAGGMEIHPFKGILVGGRYNLSFGDLYKQPSTSSPGEPVFIPTVNVRNNVVQLYCGYKF